MTSGSWINSIALAHSWWWRWSQFLRPSSISDLRPAMIPPLRRKLDASLSVIATSVILAGFCPTVQAAVSANEWKYQQTLDVGDPGLTKIPLPDTTLNLARAELA